MGAGEGDCITGEMARETRSVESSKDVTNVTSDKEMECVIKNEYDTSTSTIMMTDEEAAQTSL